MRLTLPTRAVLAALLSLVAALALPALATASHTGPTADLQVSISESVDPVIAGSNGGQSNLTYVVTARNAGPSASITSKVVLTTSGPAGVNVRSVTPSTGSYTAASKTWSLGALAPTQTATLTIVVDVPSTVPDDSVISVGATHSHANTVVGDHNPENDSDLVTTTVEQPAVAAIAPPSHDFGVVSSRTGSAAHDFTISNTGGLDLVVGDAALGGTDAGAFEIVSDACSQETLAPGDSCVISARLAPDSVGARSATLDVPTDAGNVSAALSGTGALPSASLAPASHDFGSVRTGTESGLQAFTVTNDGQVPLVISEATIGGVDASEFEVVSDACSGQTVAAGDACQVTARFAPGSRGAKSATLDVASDADGSPDSATLAGTGIAPVAAVTPASHDFGSVRTGTESGTQAFTVANDGDAPLAVSGVSLTGADADQFEIVDDACTGATVAAGDSCDVTARFAPTATGSKSGALAVASDADGSPHAAALSGTGVAPAVELTPASHDFGDVQTGTDSGTQAFTVANAGDAPLAVSGVSLTGADADQFEIVDDACTGATVAAGESCEVTARFAPTADGDKAAALAIANDADGAPHSATLAGTGFTPAPELEIDPASADFGSTDLGSASASRTFTVANVGDADGDVAGAVVDGANAGDFEVVSDGCDDVTLAPAETCQVELRFVPQAAGARSAELALDSAADQTGSALAGTGVEPSSGGGGGTGGGGTGGGGTGGGTTPVDPQPPAGGDGGPAAGVARATVTRVRGARLRTRRRGARRITTLDTGVRVSCPAGLASACRAAVTASGRATAARTVGRTTVTVPSGGSRVVRLRLSRPAIAALRSRSALTVVVRVVATATDGQRTTTVRRYRFALRGGRVRTRALR